MTSPARSHRMSRIVLAATTASLLAFGTACSADGPLEALGSFIPGATNEETNEDGLTVIADPPAEDTWTDETTVDPTQGSSGGGSTANPGSITETINPSRPEDLGFSTQNQSHDDRSGRESMVSIRSAGHAGYDRVVIEFSGSGQVGWSAGYTSAPSDGASDVPISHPGDTALQVNLYGITSPYGSGYPDITDTGVNPRDTSAVVQAKGDGWWEGSVPFVISLSGGERPYRIFSLNGPHRLVIDFQT